MEDVINKIKDVLSKNNNLNGNFANDSYTLGWIKSLVDNELMKRNLRNSNEKIKRMSIQRDTVSLRDIDVVVLHNNTNNTVSVDVYTKDSKLLAGCEVRLIGRHDAWVLAQVKRHPLKEENA